MLIVKLFLVSCILIQKKTKQNKNDRYFGMGKNTKVMPQNAPLSIFFLGKGRESLCLKPYEKLSLQVHFLTCSPACTKLDKRQQCTSKLSKMYIFSCKFCNFPVTEGNEIRHLYSSYDPNKKAHPQHEFWEQQNYSSLWTKKSSKLDPERHKFWEHQNYSSLQTRKSSKSDPERHKFWEHQNYSSLWTRESSKSNPERHEF